MRKVVFLVIISLVFLYGCGQKVEQTEMPAEVQETVTETVTVEETPVEQPQTAEQLPVVQETVTVQETATITFVKPDIKTIQQALANAGLYAGKIDGIIGPNTKQAIKDFQTQNGLTVDGKVGSKTWALLEPYLKKALESTTTE